MTSKILKLLFFLIPILYAVDLSAQTKVTGTVTNSSDRSPVAGATVTVKGTSKGTNTDATGKFSIQANIGETIVVSSIGFSEYQVKVGRNTSLSIPLESASSELSNVVVVGYGTQKKQVLPTRWRRSVVVTLPAGQCLTYSSHSRVWHPV